MCGVEEGVNVGEDGVADAHCLFRGVGDGSPAVGFLRETFDDVVVAVEGEECGHLHPAVAEFFVRVAAEAARVDAEHGDAEEGEGEGLGDGEEHVGPFGVVVAAPVRGPFAGAGEGRAAQDEGAFLGEDIEEAW